jgi:hypothetical protein
MVSFKLDDLGIIFAAPGEGQQLVEAKHYIDQTA